MDVMGQELEALREMLRKDFPDLSDQDIRKASMKLIRKRWKKQDNDWHPRTGLAAKISISEFYNLQMIRPTLPEKPDFSQVENLAVASFKKYPHQFSLVGNVEVVEEVSSPSLFSVVTGEETKIENSRPQDFILMKSTLCTSLPFVNANGDAFDSDDLVESVESGQMGNLQPAIVDWRHDFQVHGNTIKAEIIENELEIEGFGKNKVKQIIVYSVFYAWLNPHKAKKIRQWAEKGVLTFSMACGAEEQEYLNGGAVRVLRKPHFVANSVIPPDLDPADDNAVLMEIAGKDNKEIPIVYASYNEYPKNIRNNLKLAWANDESEPFEEDKNIGVDMDKIKELEDKIVKLEAEKTNLESENSKLKESESAKKIIALEGEIETSKAELQEANDKLAKAEENLSTAQSEKDSLAKELEKAKSDLKDMRQIEVDHINEGRKEKLAEVFGEDKDKADYWYAQYEAKLDEDGEIYDPADEFNKALENMPTAEKVEPTKIDGEEVVEGEEVGDVEESDKVKRSKKVVVATKVVPDDKKSKAFNKTM